MQYIIQLTSRDTPPSPQTVKNMAEELSGTSVGKSWTNRFLKRHKNWLKSIYFRSIDHLRQKADYIPHITEFYKLVGQNFSLVLFLFDEFS